MSQPVILIVDDSPTALRMTSELLESHGFDVLTANDGVEAIEIAEQHLPDLMLLGIVLPGRNGFQVCRKLRANDRTKYIRIVMLSSKSQAHDRLWARRQGADGYLTKPFNDSTLLASVRSVLSSDDSQTDEPFDQHSQRLDGAIL